MRRREFVTFLGGAAVTLPLTARGQQPGMPVIGFLGTRASGDDPQLLIAFHRGLKEAVSSLGAYEAKQLTSSVPIVVVYSADPIGIGLVDSLVRPGGNVTGLSLMGGDLIAKRLGLLKEAVPMMSRVTLLYDPTLIINPSSQLSGRRRRFSGFSCGH
jgi:putative ABC transport system substrate-binding protein